MGGVCVLITCAGALSEGRDPTRLRAYPGCPGCPMSSHGCNAPHPLNPHQLAHESMHF